MVVELVPEQEVNSELESAALALESDYGRNESGVLIIQPPYLQSN